MQERSGLVSAVEKGSKARVGGPAKGQGRGGLAKGSWPPFEPGNQAAVRHGAYSSALRLAPRAAEIAACLHEAMGDAFEERDGPAIEAVALAGARIERAMTVLLADVDEDEEPLTREEAIGRLSADARSWLRVYLEGLTRLGLTPEAGTPAVQVQVAAITVEQDAATQARILAKLRAIGLVGGNVVDVEADELVALPEAPVPEESRSPLTAVSLPSRVSPPAEGATP